MTTFAFINNEILLGTAQVLEFTNHTIYTVPSGKVARVQMDSIHLYAKGDAKFEDVAFSIWSKPNNTFCKHITGDYSYRGDGGNSVKTVAFYPNWTVPVTNTFSAGGTNYFNYSANAQMENWIQQNESFSVDKDVVSGYPDAQTNTNAGTRLWAPKQFFLSAGEVLKLNGETRTQLNFNTGLYFNTRLAVWLEDV